ncbi:hypothetical protein [Breoghania sp.]|uniref:hypothetical protein n=1 Tax=Breoghania sp. TaxID=2065378 RepID=UPI002AA78394|nr:hypothetical protein [Breoghania sp.]
MLLQNAADLLFGKSTAFRLWFFLSDQSLFQTGLVQWGNVTLAQSGQPLHPADPSGNTYPVSRYRPFAHGFALPTMKAYAL